MELDLKSSEGKKNPNPNGCKVANYTLFLQIIDLNTPPTHLCITARTRSLQICRLFGPKPPIIRKFLRICRLFPLFHWNQANTEKITALSQEFAITDQNISEIPAYLQAFHPSYRYIFNLNLNPLVLEQCSDRTAIQNILRRPRQHRRYRQNMNIGLMRLRLGNRVRNDDL